MPDPVIQRAKRRQAIGIGLFLIALSIGLSLLYHAVRPGAVAFRRGENAYARGEFAQAAAYYRAAYTSGLRSLTLHRHLALALLQIGRESEALDLLLPALAHNPADVGLRNLAVGMAQSLGRPEVGLQIYSALGPPVNIGLADLVRLADLNQQAGYLEAAVDCMKLAVARAPDVPELHLLQGQYLARLGRFDAAAATLRTALQLAPDSRPARLALARVLAWSHDYPAAIAAYQNYLNP